MRDLLDELNKNQGRILGKLEEIPSKSEVKEIVDTAIAKHQQEAHKSPPPSLLGAFASLPPKQIAKLVALLIAALSAVAAAVSQISL